jgi:hypothetical protein
VYAQLLVVCLLVSLSVRLLARAHIFCPHYLLLSSFSAPLPGLPVPFSPRVTLCLADPIEVTAVRGVEGPDGKVTIPQEAIEELHQKYILSITEMFDRYKAEAGYPDAVLEIQ